MSHNIDEYIGYIRKAVEINDEEAFNRIINALYAEFHKEKGKRLSFENFRRRLNESGTIKVMNEGAEYSLLGYAVEKRNENIFNGVKALGASPLGSAKTVYRHDLSTGKYTVTRYTFEQLVAERIKRDEAAIKEISERIQKNSQVGNGVDDDIRVMTEKRVSTYQLQKRAAEEDRRTALNLKDNLDSLVADHESVLKELENIAISLDKHRERLDIPEVPAFVARQVRGSDPTISLARERLERVLKYSGYGVMEEFNNNNFLVNTPCGKMTVPQFFVHYGFQIMVPNMEDNSLIYISEFEEKSARGAGFKVNENARTHGYVRVADAVQIEKDREKVRHANEADRIVNKDIIKPRQK